MTFSPVCLPLNQKEIYPSYLINLRATVEMILSSLTEMYYMNLINQLNPYKSCGPDNCYPHVLKEVKDGLILPLFCLFNKSLQESCLLSCWKLASVTVFIRKGTYHFQVISTLSASPQYFAEYSNQLLKTR